MRIQVFAQRYPRYILRLVNKHEEFYATLMFFVERHYLRKHGAEHQPGFCLKCTHALQVPPSRRTFMV